MSGAGRALPHKGLTVLQAWNATETSRSALRSRKKATIVFMWDCLLYTSDLPESIRKSFLPSDGQATLIELLPIATLSPNQQIRWVREVRSSDVAAITGVPGAVLRVGGVPALEADYDSVVKERMPKVVLGVVLGLSLIHI